MIRSLFLIGILVILAAIAFKKPDQTALDFAREVSGKAQATLAAQSPQSDAESRPQNNSGDVNQATPPRPDKWDEISKRLKTAIEKADKKHSPPDVPSAHRNSTNPQLPSPQSMVRKSPVEIATRSSITPPKMPSVPVPNVDAKPLIQEMDHDRKRVTVAPAPTKPDLTEVRLNLENAARLLSEVK